MNTDNFKWTDELVEEYIKEYHGTSTFGISHFKQSKQPPIGSKDWEILSFKCNDSIYRKVDNGKFYSDMNIFAFTEKEFLINSSPKSTIHSVRRISDGEVFTVGDKVQHHFSKREIVIDNFNIHAEYIYANSKGESGEFLLRSLIRSTPSPKPPLGVMPKWLWEETRLEELTKAIERYKEAGKEIPQEWIDEQYALSKKIKLTTKEYKRIEISRVERHDTLKGNKWDSFFYQFCSSNSIPKDKFPAIKSAIENVLNGISTEDQKFIELLQEQLREKRYTQSEVDAMMEKAFNAARETDVSNGSWLGHLQTKEGATLVYKTKYPTFSDYKKLNP